MKNRIIAILILGCTTCLNAQPWTPSTNGIYYNSGKVGIGLTDPAFGLSINAIEDQMILGGNKKSVIRIMNGFAQGFGRRSEIQFGLSQLSDEILAVIAAEYSDWNGHIGGDLLFGTTPTNAIEIIERMRINRNGYVGIGTNNPAAKLDIFGNTWNSTNIILSADYIDKYRWRMKTIDRGNAIDMDFTSSDGNDIEETVLKLSRSNSTRPEFQLYNNAIVSNNGNVGIGTDKTSNAKLTVAGMALVEELLVELETAWPDYVFEPDHKLTPLRDLESYIKEHKHLPEVPTAEEVKENGLKIGEMNALLLKKIEELTLYMIELKKENEKLQSKYSELEAKFEKQ